MKLEGALQLNWLSLYDSVGVVVLVGEGEREGGEGVRWGGKGKDKAAGPTKYGLVECVLVNCD